MPCYCDTPDSENQVEIEKRAKENMYFEAIAIFDKDNLKIANEKNLEICQFPLPDSNTALCKICKVLRKEQMENISSYWYQIKWKHENLYDWYRQHCKDDKNHENF